MIITERFLATHQPPQTIGEFKWRFYARGRASEQPYYEIEFDVRFREFKGWRAEPRRYWNTMRSLSEADIAKLRAMLNPADIVRCTKAAMKVPL